MKKTIAFSGIFFLTLVFISGCKKEVVKHPPVACFSQNVDHIVINETVDFTNCSTGGLSYVWNFGDGQTSNEFSPSHTYTTAGTFTVTLNVTNADGTTNKTATVMVQGITSSQYAGNFSVTETCTSGSYSFTTAITTNGSSGITVSDFGGFGISATGTISGFNCTFPSQTQSGLTVSGTGNLSANFNTLTLSYHATDGTNTDDCVDVYTRQ